MRARLDTFRRHFYKAAPAWAAAVLLGLSSGALASQDEGVQLPDGAVRVGEDRFRAPKDYEATLRFYRTIYPRGTYTWREIIDQPGVKGLHIELRRVKGVEGLNIYRANGEVRIYIVPADPEPAAKKKKREHRRRR